MNRIEQEKVRASSLLITVITVLTLLFFGGANQAHAQWSTPDGAGNITNTNTGNVGISLPTGTSPGTRLDVGGAVRSYNFFGPQQTAFTLGTDSGIVSGPGSGAAIQLFGTAGAGGLANQLRFLTGGSSLQYRMTIDGAGNVGVGTTAPVARFQIVTANDTSGMIPVWDSRFFVVGADGNSGGISLSYNQSTNTGYLMSLSPNVAWRNTVINPYAGNVGIGTTNPQARLDVNGDINVSGNINAKYQDVAEWVRSRQKLQAGTVVILDPEKSNQVIASSTSYDTRVAGVISERPGLLLGEGGEGKVKVATTGRVSVKVDASCGAIKIGDLLVTSDKEGVAMKSEPILIQGRKIHAPGTIIGKALEPLESGVGEIQVLLSLQ
jgi:hypothetical protein